MAIYRVSSSSNNIANFTLSYVIDRDGLRDSKNTITNMSTKGRTMTDYGERIARGIQMLKERHGADCLKNIDVDKINTEQFAGSVELLASGQTSFTQYWEDYCADKGLPSDTSASELAASFGFQLSDYEDSGTREYVILTEMWKNVVRQEQGLNDASRNTLLGRN